MTLDQQIQVWNVVGTWLAGFATFAAVAVSLYLAKRAESIRVKVNVGLRLTPDGPRDTEEHIGFIITNIGVRQAKIDSIGWSIGKENKRPCVQVVDSRDRYPKNLLSGEATSLLFSFKNNPNWITEFASNFLQDLSDENLKTLRAQIYISGEKIIEVIPEKNLLKRLQAIERNKQC